MDTKILIVEDQTYQAFDLIDRLKKFGYLNILGPFDSGEEALKVCEKDMPDLAILDIDLSGEMTGLDLAQRLNEMQKVAVIYLTNQEDDATTDQSLETDYVAYINKPHTSAELKMAVAKAVKILNENSGDSTAQVVKPLTAVKDQNTIERLDDRVFIRTGTKRPLVMLEDIAWLQSTGQKGESTIIFLAKEEEKGRSNYTVSHGLKDVLERLHFYEPLTRVSKSHIVNLNKVTEVDDQSRINGQDPNKILLVDGEKIEVGRVYRKSVMKKLHFL